MQENFFYAFLFSFLATAAFGILFQAPRKSLVTSGIIGAVGWVIFVFLRFYLEHNSFYANFLATIFIALSSEFVARVFKQPVTVYVLPGIIPLVPGLGMYRGMTKIIEKNYDAGMDTLLTAGTDAAAIALGMMFMASVFRVIKISKERQQLLQRLQKLQKKI